MNQEYVGVDVPFNEALPQLCRVTSCFCSLIFTRLHSTVEIHEQIVTSKDIKSTSNQ